jgi:hypothetical protein
VTHGVRRIACALAVVLAIPGAARASAASGACDIYAPDPVETGHTPRLVAELSGFVASRRHPGIFWAHNDSGHELVLYALRDDGRVVASFPVLDVNGVDPEDVAIGPCAPREVRTCLYVADTGDNLRSRAQAQVIRVLEPVVLRSGPLVGEAFPFTYPDGAHDAEGILVDPRSADVLVVTKALLSLGDVYRVDVHGKPRRVRAVHVATLSIPNAFDALVTGAAVHPGGTRVLLRTYRGVWEFRRPGATDLVDVLRAPPRDVPAAMQLQGEAVSYTADGTGYLLGSEGEGAPLFRVDCRTPERRNR